MISFVVVVAFLAGTSQGFSQVSLSQAQILRHSQCLVNFESPDANTGSPALKATATSSDNIINIINNNNNNNNSANTILRATRFSRTRRNVFGIAFCGLLTTLLGATPMSANAFSDARGGSRKPNPGGASSSGSSSMQRAIAYRTLSLPVAEFGIKVPISIWYPVTDERASDSSNPLPPDVKYDYKISLRRIGQLLAKWEFIPEFISKDFSLTPSASTSSIIRVVDGKSIPISGTTTKAKQGDEAAKTGTKVVFLAHGYLGSRSDLGYIAEDLASQGFVCVAAEYPESLEASYPRLDGLDRAAINRQLIPYVKDMVPQPILSYSAIGHSLGCGTVLQMGDDSWNRVLMGSGKAPESPSKIPKASVVGKNVVGGRLLFISSVNDGPVTSWGGGIQIPEGYTVLKESELLESGSAAALQLNNLDRAALVFNGETAPNHISYLSENVNDAMLSFLSPLLPVTNALDIPVLDFDKYADSRDSVATGRVLKPLISGFLSGSP